MKILSALLLSALAATLTYSCKSPGSDADLPCRCGTQLADFEGCDHAACRKGENNPGNPACVCGKLDIPSGKKD